MLKQKRPDSEGDISTAAHPDTVAMSTSNTTKRPFALVVHGGAGTIRRDATSSPRAASYHEALYRALTAGRDVVADGGTALDAVTRAVVALEDDPLFNAARGSGFTAAGTQEMDAELIDGRDPRAGAVAGIFGLRNPILAARAVMEKRFVTSGHSGGEVVPIERARPR
jgi:L-asparaginase / beta-aspartyl-peptidase